MAADDLASTAWANEVRLTGRVSGNPEQREMPSGDVVVLFRVVVPRPAARLSSSARGPSRKGAATVDTIDIACWSARTRRAALRLRQGETAEVTGSLRRRFFRAGGGAASRYEVDAATVARPRAGA
jgi:single-strand DNA-binding protein